MTVTLAGALVLTACGGDDPGSDPDPDAGASGSEDDASEPETIPISIIEPLSGDFSSFGVDSAQGAQFALEEINEEGGFEVDGTTYTFEVDIVDAQSDPTVAAQAAQEAITGGTQLILGSIVSALAEPIAAAVQRAGGEVLQLGPATALDGYAGGDDPIFRSLPPDDLTAELYIPVLRAEFPELDSLSALMINDAIGQSVLEIYLPVFEQEGFEVATSDAFPADESNFSPLLNRTPSDVDAFFIGYSDSVSLSIIEAALEVGRNPIFFNRGSQCQTGLDVGDRIEAYTCIIYTEDPFFPGTDAAEDFYTRYEERFGVERDSNTAQALYLYDYVYLLVEAMKSAGTVDDVPAIADALRGSSYSGVLDVAFDDDGVNTASINVGIVRDGEVDVIPAAAP